MKMKKSEFMTILKSRLKENYVEDINEIAVEYEEHFYRKSADGYSEEETAAQLGDPKFLADQFSGTCISNRTPGKKYMIISGLAICDIFAVMFFLLLFGWVLVLGAFAIASAGVGFCLALNVNIASFLPPMPYFCKLMFSLAFLPLAGLSGIAAVYCFTFIKQLVRCYMRFCQNCLSSSSGKGLLPTVPLYPLFSNQIRRTVRRITLILLSVFAVMFIVSFIACAVSAGAFEFWHKWNWFV